VTVFLDGLLEDVVACFDRVEGEDGTWDCGVVVVSINSVDSVDLEGKASTDMLENPVLVSFCEGSVGVPIVEGLVTDLALALALAKRYRSALQIGQLYQNDLITLKSVTRGVSLAVGTVRDHWHRNVNGYNVPTSDTKLQRIHHNMVTISFNNDLSS
jgi:hypothetical protein